MRRQHGFALIATVAALVVLAGMAAAMLSFGSAQQIGSAQDVLSARAWQAARAGNEWGLYKALQEHECAMTTLDLRAETGFSVTVTCEKQDFMEGETVPGAARQVTFYEIKAVACPATACPASDPAVVASPGYVERTRVVLASGG